jgi:hypothetical protein
VKVSNDMLTAIAQHKERRRRETRKVAPAIPLDEQDVSSDEPEDYREYGNPKDDYAQAVGISRTREL